jgi:hypothetical protein
VLISVKLQLVSTLHLGEGEQTNGQSVTSHNVGDFSPAEISRYRSILKEVIAVTGMYVCSTKHEQSERFSV